MRRTFSAVQRMRISPAFDSVGAVLDPYTVPEQQVGGGKKGGLLSWGKPWDKVKSARHTSTAVRQIGKRLDKSFTMRKFLNEEVEPLWREINEALAAAARRQLRQLVNNDVYIELSDEARLNTRPKSLSLRWEGEWLQCESIQARVMDAAEVNREFAQITCELQTKERLGVFRCEDEAVDWKPWQSQKQWWVLERELMGPTPRWILCARLGPGKKVRIAQ